VCARARRAAPRRSPRSVGDHLDAHQRHPERPHPLGQPGGVAVLDVAGEQLVADDDHRRLEQCGTGQRDSLATRGGERIGGYRGASVAGRVPRLGRCEDRRHPGRRGRCVRRRRPRDRRPAPRLPAPGDGRGRSRAGLGVRHHRAGSAAAGPSPRRSRSRVRPDPSRPRARVRGCRGTAGSRRRPGTRPDHRRVPGSLDTRPARGHRRGDPGARGRPGGGAHPRGGAAGDVPRLTRRRDVPVGVTSPGRTAADHRARLGTGRARGGRGTCDRRPRAAARRAVRDDARDRGPDRRSPGRIGDGAARDGARAGDRGRGHPPVRDRWATAGGSDHGNCTPAVWRSGRRPWPRCSAAARRPGGRSGP
jgi:hypothetical protein